MFSDNCTVLVTYEAIAEEHAESKEMRREEAKYEAITITKEREKWYRL